ncbi:MAG: hypothetical protein CMO55_07300 [Verrucomicrobiales bacterium]|nr:hypothetical protein [Verrucomicrobiales bacterium]
MRRLIPFALLVTTLLLPGLASAEAWTEPLNQLKKVGPEGAGNEAAAEAWQTLTDQGSAIIIPTLDAMEGSSPLAKNWMRTAVETVFANELQKEGELPAAEIRAFVADRENEPNARFLAFDLYSQISPDEAAKMVPDMLDDPSTGLRRNAVAQLITEGKKALDAGNKEEATTILGKALDGARDVDQIDEIAKLLREKLEQKVDLPKHFGFLMRWQVIAPFDNTDREGFEEVFPPENEIDLDATYKGKEEKEVSWQAYTTSDDYGMVDFNQPYSPLKQVVGYAYTEFDSAEERAAQIRLGCKNAWKIWLNGELLFGRDEYHRGMRIDQYTLPIILKKGKNTILVKACQNEQEQDWTVQWQFQLRVCDSTGTAIHSTDRQPTPEPEAATRRRPNQ